MDLEKQSETTKVEWSMGRVERVARWAFSGVCAFILLVTAVQFFGLTADVGASRDAALAVWSDSDADRATTVRTYSACLEEAMAGRGPTSIDGCIDVAASGQKKLALVEVLTKADHAVEQHLQAPLRWFLTQ